MKKITILFLLAGFITVGASGVDFDIHQEYYYEDETLSHYAGFMDPDRLFDEFGCLIPDMAGITESDMPCLDLNNDGCVTRESWDAFMDYWKIHTPEPDIGLCEQMLS
jgi:hypothetical protein